jgi:hypothetical protein
MCVHVLLRARRLVFFFQDFGLTFPCRTMTTPDQIRFITDFAMPWIVRELVGMRSG